MAGEKQLAGYLREAEEVLRGGGRQREGLGEELRRVKEEARN